MTGYTDTIRKYAMDDRFTGELPDADGSGEVGLGADEAGKRLAVRFMLKLAGGKIARVRFQVFGCGFTIAACSAAAELAQGKSLQGAMALNEQQIDRQLEGLPAERSYCAELALGALRAAVASAAGDHQPVRHNLNTEEDHRPQLSADDPFYRQLLATSIPEGISAEDRHLFACLLATASREPWPLAAALGLSADELDALGERLFPGGRLPEAEPTRDLLRPPEVNPEVRELLHRHIPADRPDRDRQLSIWLADILAARAAHPGHLWVACGLFERPELTSGIRRQLPSLAAANANNMRWKRYLFKQICDLNGGVMCKSPDCGLCSDYALCFAPEEV